MAKQPEGARYVVLGAGRQGVAAAYDLAINGGSSSLTLADSDPGAAKAAVLKIRGLLPAKIRSGFRLESVSLDASRPFLLTKLLKGSDAVLSALPYRLNPAAAEAAIEAKVHYCDLGGHLETTRKILRLDGRARRAGITLIPDCGLAPGLSNLLAVRGMERLDISREVVIYCGGLPQHPRPPLNYKTVYSLEGLLGIYLGKAAVLRKGRVAEIPALTEHEELEFGPPLGRLEAFVTGGGTSTCPWSFEGRLSSYEYKTLRYPGHFEKIRFLLEMGLLDEKPLEVDGLKVSPRSLFIQAAKSRLSFSKDKDLVVLRVIVRGFKAERPGEICYDLLDLQDQDTGFSAMERTTGFSTAVVLKMLAGGRIKERGAVPPEKSVPAAEFLREMRGRGFEILETFRRPR